MRWNVRLQWQQGLTNREKNPLAHRTSKKNLLVRQKKNLLQGSYRNRKSKFQDFSRTFQGLITFFQESFFIDSNSPNTAYTQDFCPIHDSKCISLSSSLFLPDYSSAYCLRRLLSFLPFPISALQGFTFGCILFVLFESNGTFEMGFYHLQSKHCLIRKYIVDAFVSMMSRLHQNVITSGQNILWHNVIHWITMMSW